MKRLLASILIAAVARPGLTMKTTHLIAVVAAITAAIAVSPSVAAAPAPPARCSVVYRDGHAVVSHHEAGQWHVEECIFNRVVHGRTVAQVGVANIGLPQPRPRPLSCVATYLGSWPAIRGAR